MTARPHGMNIIGNVSANTGLGVHARQIVDLLVAKGHEVGVFDVDPGHGRSGHDQRFSHLTARVVDELPHAINLFVLEPTAVFHFLAANYDFCFAPERFNTAIAMWELPKVPQRWVEGFRALDAVLAASDFVRGTFEAHLSDTFIVPAPCPLFVPEEVVPNREAFGLPTEVVLFVTSFDPGSDPERKNPFASVRAFIRAFVQSNNACLVVKVNNPSRNGVPHPALEKLRALSRDYPNVLILDKVMSYPETLSLYASCDVFVSLHRAEGLGLGLMEAMALGKPVVATAWSGNMSFMDHTNSCLVGYKLVPVKSDLPAYKALGDTVEWAEPSEDKASAWMRELVRKPCLREQIGQSARQSMADYQCRAKAAHFLDELHAILENRAFMPRKAIPHAADLWNAARIKDHTSLDALSTTLTQRWNKHIGWRLRRS